MHTTRCSTSVQLYTGAMASNAKDGNDMTKVAEQMWKYLDNLSANKPDEYKKFIEQQLEEGKQMFTPPEPVYCMHCQVRAWVSHENMCSSKSKPPTLPFLPAPVFIMENSIGYWILSDLILPTYTMYTGLMKKRYSIHCLCRCWGTTQILYTSI